MGEREKLKQKYHNKLISKIKLNFFMLGKQFSSTSELMGIK